MLAKKIGTLLAGASILAGCGTIPDVTVNYYFPRAKTAFVVTQTIGCNAKADKMHRAIRSVISVAPTQTTAADLGWVENGRVKQGHLQYKSFRSTLSDADATVTLTADGRLSGINATSTGEGSTIIQDLVTVAGTIAIMAPNDHNAAFVENIYDQACDLIDIYGAIPSAAADKPSAVVTLTYSVTVAYDVPKDAAPTFVVDRAASPLYPDAGDKTSLILIPDAASEPVYTAIHRVLGSSMESTLKMVTTASTPDYLNTISPQTATGKDEFALDLNRVATISLEIDGHVGDLTKNTPVWSASYAVPVRETYQLAVPSPATFGKTAFGVQLSDSGAITQLHYGSNAGTGDAANAVNAVAKGLQPQSPEDRATALKGQSDLIAQQQTLVRCQVSPTTCT